MLYATLYDSGGINIGKIEVPFIDEPKQLENGGNFHYAIEYYASPEEKAKYSFDTRYLDLMCKTFVCDNEIFFMACWWRYKALVECLHNNTVKESPITFSDYIINMPL